MSYYNYSEAVDYQRFATQPQVKENNKGIEVLPENHKAKKAARVPYGKYAVIVGCVFAVLMAILSGYTSITELTVQNDRLKDEIAELESTENALNAKKEQMYNLSYVEEYAKNVLGMVKLDKSQVSYVELSSPEKMVINTEKEENSSKFFANVVKSFNIVLEYLN